jgi:hypothetical protein
VWFNEAELHALLTMQQMLAGLDEQGVVGRHLQPMFDKITGMLGVDQGEAQELRRRVKLIGTARRRIVGELRDRGQRGREAPPAIRYRRRRAAS